MTELSFLFFVLSCTTVSTINAEATLKNKVSKDKDGIVSKVMDIFGNDAMTIIEVRI